MRSQNYRLVTRSDFDGLVCGVLLREQGLIDDILFVHPKDMQDGLVPIGPRDIITNLPFVPGCHFTFDHHASEVTRNGTDIPPNHIIDPTAPSAARVVYDHFGGAAAFPRVDPGLLDAVDKADSAQFTITDILKPQGWVLLNFIMDPRTGLGRFRNFRISNYSLMMRLIEECRTMSVEEILALPDVRERVELYEAQAGAFKAQLRRCARVTGSLVTIDLRDEAVVHAGNRFMVYALYPECDISLHVLWGLKQQSVSFAVGKSILDRGSKVDVGTVCLTYGGGGHADVGTCQVAPDEADEVKDALVRNLSRPPVDDFDVDMAA
jgi:nanoRNase/pAp phosphatase (c-di-AMP/oligoRNAs hydrolase)